jgi:hypothetical protein
LTTEHLIDLGPEGKQGQTKVKDANTTSHLINLVTNKEGGRDSKNGESRVHKKRDLIKQSLILDQCKENGIRDGDIVLKKMSREPLNDLKNTWDEIEMQTKINDHYDEKKKKRKDDMQSQALSKYISDLRLENHRFCIDRERLPYEFPYLRPLIIHCVLIFFILACIILCSFLSVTNYSSYRNLLSHRNEYADRECSQKVINYCQGRVIFRSASTWWEELKAKILAWMFEIFFGKFSFAFPDNDLQLGRTIYLMSSDMFTTEMPPSTTDLIHDFLYGNYTQFGLKYVFVWDDCENSVTDACNEAVDTVYPILLSKAWWKTFVSAICLILFVIIFIYELIFSRMYHSYRMSVEIGNIHLHSSPDGDLRRDIDLRMKALHSDIVMADVHITYYQVYKSYWNARVIWKSKIQTLTTSNVVNYEQFIQLIKHSNLNITLDKKSALIKINQDMNNLSSVNYSRYLISDQISQNTANLVYFYFCHNRDRNHSKQLFQGLFEKVLTVL